MEMITHQTPGMDPPTGFFAGLAQGFLKKFPIAILAEDGLSPVASIHDVINGAGILHPQFSSHDCQCPKSSADSQTRILIMRD
jgi:hypothetical protein